MTRGIPESEFDLRIASANPEDAILAAPENFDKLVEGQLVRGPKSGKIGMVTLSHEKFGRRWITINGLADNEPSWMNKEL